MDAMPLPAHLAWQITWVVKVSWHLYAPHAKTRNYITVKMIAPAENPQLLIFKQHGLWLWCSWSSFQHWCIIRLISRNFKFFLCLSHLAPSPGDLYISHLFNHFPINVSSSDKNMRFFRTLIERYTVIHAVLESRVWNHVLTSWRRLGLKTCGATKRKLFQRQERMNRSLRPLQGEIAESTSSRQQQQRTLFLPTLASTNTLTYYVWYNASEVAGKQSLYTNRSHHCRARDY